MSSSKEGHTPGPWNTCNNGRTVVQDCGVFKVVAQTYNGCDSCMAESKSNARLIAAAPDLLYAADNAMSTCSPAAAKIIREAIAKATGRDAQDTSDTEGDVE